MSRYDLGRLAHELRILSIGSNTTAVGRNLQNLAEYLISHVPGASIEDRNRLNVAGNGETDLWLKHDPRRSGFPFFDLVVPVECKNEQECVSSAEISRFATQIRDSGGFDGLLVAAAGLAGSPGSRAHQQVTIELSRMTRITIITKSDIAILNSTEDFVRLLQDRYTELRLSQTYTSI